MSPTLFLALAACSGRSPGPPGVLLVTVDTWRADHLTATHSPNAWRLGHSGLRFEDAWSPIGLTTAAHASLFTGRQPPATGVRGNNHHGYELAGSFTTVAESFAAAGWSTAAFVSGWPAGPAGGLEQGWERFSGPLAGEREGTTAVAEAVSWIGARRQRWLAWVHLYEPHGPYAPPAEDLQAVDGQDTDRDRYGGEVHAADRYLAPLLEAARGAGASIVLTSDHGEVLDEERCGWQHERSATPEVLRIPLVIAGPDIEPATRSERVGLVDLYPTLHGLAGLTPPAGHDGQDLLSAPHEGRAVWVGEAGLCDPECAAGCRPAGFAGKDVVVYAGDRSCRDRRGTPGTGDASLAPHLEGWRPVQLPTTSEDAARTEALGYTEP